MNKNLFRLCISAALCLPLLNSCSKLLEVSPPISSITTEEIFSTNKQADWAVSGMYTNMINPKANDFGAIGGLPRELFSAGFSTLQGGLSSDELILSVNISNADYFSQRNQLTLANSTPLNQLWYSCYKTIFNANAVIDGISASSSPALIDSVKKQLTGEALAIRAFSYFYLVNFYGDVPLVLSSDFKKTNNLPRVPVTQVYTQIKADLITARSFLSNDFSVSKNERVRVNRWFAEALLARVYLFSGEYQAAITSASAVINHSTLFGLEDDISHSFLPNSKEAVFQLEFAAASLANNATPEGILFSTRTTDDNYFLPLSSHLLAAFEPNDKRKTVWTQTHGAYTAPRKYSDGSVLQHYTVMRLAELFLIRAEATVLSSPAAKNNAIDDLNRLRRRAGVEELDYQLTADQVVEAVAQERRIELFAEWGHRWFDLKRTGKASEVLSAISYKQPWAGNYQLLYPIPEDEINSNGQLIQNPQYNIR